MIGHVAVVEELTEVTESRLRAAFLLAWRRHPAAHCLASVIADRDASVLPWSGLSPQPPKHPKPRTSPIRGEVSGFRWECRAKLFDGFALVSLVSLGHGLGNQT